MGTTPVKLEEGYSVGKGIKKAVIAVLVPAVGTLAATLLLDPGFVTVLTGKVGALVGSGVATALIAFAVNWAKNRNK